MTTISISKNLTTGNAFLAASKQRMETFLAQTLPPINTNNNGNTTLLPNAMRYAVLDAGKRLRPALVYATGKTLGIDNLALLDAAAASVELIHCYSLIHDDLPAMDNDDFRRGKPACHKEFDEATAILAGDALQTLAFEVLCNEQLNPHPINIQLKMINTLATAAGYSGMILGQAEDLASENSSISLTALKQLHQKKTGALIEAAMQLGILGANCQTAATIKKLSEYGKYIGLAFQIHDDILDVTGDTKTLGKPTGSDQQQGKSTFVTLMGLEDAKNYAKSLQQQALEALEEVGPDAELLKEISVYFINRCC